MKYGEYLITWMDRYGREHTRTATRATLGIETEHLDRWIEKNICTKYTVTVLGGKEV